MHWTVRYVGRPYAGEMDCAELVREVLNRELGLRIELLGDAHWRRTSTGELVEYAKGRFGQVWEPQEFDVVLMKLLGNRTTIGSHVGVYVERSKVLHSIRHCGSIITDVGRLKSLNLEIEGYYRDAGRI